MAKLRSGYLRSPFKPFFLIACFLASGCAETIDWLAPGQQRLVGAAPLSTTVPYGTMEVDQLLQPRPLAGSTPRASNSQGSLATIPVTPNNYLAAVLADSSSKCRAFVGLMSAGQKSTQLSLDILTTIAAALGTAFTPLATTHAFSAAAAITSGSRAAYNADLFNQYTAFLIKQQLDNTYFQQNEEYARRLLTRRVTADQVMAEFNIINNIHSRCSLDSAVASLTAAAAKTPQSSRPPTSEADLRPNTPITAADGSVYVIQRKQGDIAEYIRYGGGENPHRRRSVIADLLDRINGE